MASIAAQHLFGQRIAAIPYPLQVYNEPAALTVTDDLITISAKGKTNLFNNPNGQYYVQDAPMLLFEPAGDFTLSSRVTGDLQSVYDVAALVVYQDRDLWAKFCYENSVEKQPLIVSVVTRKYSDDCNSVPAGSYAYLRIVRQGKEFTFSYSPDGTRWSTIRHFHLDVAPGVKAGFAAHGSRGDGFTAKFSEIRYSDSAVQ